MAHDVSKSLRELSTVRVPVRVHACVSTFLDFLKVRILEQAARQANARRKKNAAGLITADDVLQSARELFPDAASELEQILSGEEIHGAPRKRAS